MCTQQWRWVTVFVLAIGVAGCGGGGGDDSDTPTSGTPTPPAANVVPTVSFMQPAASSALEQGATAHVIVEADDADGSIAQVTLSMNGTLISEDTTAPYEWATPGSTDHAALRDLAIGDYELTALATDDDGGEASTTMTFTVSAASPPPPTQNQPPTVSFTQPTQGTTYAAGDSAYVIVAASDDDGTVANVRLLLDGTLVRQENVAPYEWAAPGGTADPVLNNLAVGDYTLTAIATDDDNAESTTEVMFSVTAVTPPPPGPNGSCTAGGDLRQWHRAAIECTGFSASEDDASTFTDYRFDVTFTQGGNTITVPGHFAADGNAADSGASAGDTWRAYFSPPTTGTWQYAVSFRTGANIAVNEAPNAGAAMDVIDGISGTLNVAAAPSPSTDMRTRGLLQHRDGERYMRFAGTDAVYIEGGMDSPENIFGYSEFDNTTKFSDANSCKGILHDFAPHSGDWNNGDPQWGGNRGRSLIGLINYISSTGVNAIYIMMNTVRGDGCDAHPWLEYNASGTEKRFDVSKLDQWERALTHMTANGILIHVMTQETENDQLLNGGNLGVERQLYYRELISRFGHHPALQWNLGEENTNTPAQQRAFADFIRAQDPYDHPIFMHTYPNEKDRYDDLLGHATFDGPTLQYGAISTDPSSTTGLYGAAADWISRSTQAGKTWVVTATEASGNNAPTPNTAVTSRQRVYWMWASVMSGGAGFEWYLKNDGAGHAYDLAVEDLREFDAHWLQSGHLVRFFRDTLQVDLGIDLQQLTPDNAVTSSNTDWVLADSGNAYLIYLREGGGTDINLPDNASYDVLWFNPRTGTQMAGNTLQGQGNQFVGMPPSDSSEDWAVVVTSADATTPTAQYTQADGLVIMEAENTATTDTGLWSEKTDVAGFTGASYIEFDGNSALSGPPGSPLTYTFTINQDGLHYLHLHVARETLVINGETRTDVANDAYVRLDGDYGPGPNAGNNHADDAPLSALQSDTKFFGGNDNQFVWASGNRLDLGGETNKRVAIYDLKAGETYTFTISGRSRYFKINRIVFRHESVSRANAQDTSRPETL
ncbi:MAG: Ig-like domain-containing protein [Pseudomonadota bacterium]